MVLWGSKGPTAPSLTLSNINMSDRKLQPGGKISRDPSPRPAMIAHLAQQRDINQEEYRRRERLIEKIRDKAKYNDMDTWERCRERDSEWTERERRQEDDRSRNMRALLNVEKHIEREIERGMKKGDTFPRMAKGYVDYGRRKMSATVTDEERGERRKRDRQRQTETDDWEREREGEWQRERYRERERDAIREEGKTTGRRLVEDEKLRERERYQEPDAQIQDRRREVGDSRDRRERYATRNRENPRPKGEKEGRTPSPHRQRDREIDSDRWEKEKAPKSGGRRDTRSEGDSGERERVRDREKEHSKSEGDNKGKRVREGDRDRHGYKGDNGQRYRDGDRKREVDRSRKRGVEKDRERYRDVDKRETEGEKWRERRVYLKDDRAWSNDRRDDSGYREYKFKKHRERKEREADHWDDTSERSSRSLNQTAPRVPPQALSSGEWSNDMDSEMRNRIGKDSYEERELGKKSTSINEKDIEEQRDPERIAERNQMKQKNSERHDSDTGEMTGSTPAQRRMWLEPQRNKNSKEEFVDRERHQGEKERRREEQRSMESRANWAREGWREKQHPDQHLNQHSYRGTRGGRNEYRGDTEWETEGVSVDGEELDEVLRETDNGREEHLSDSHGGIEGSRRRDAEGENVADNTEDSDREEEGGSNYFTQVGSETGWKQKTDRSLSGEDFVTVSSGGDDDEEREQDEDEEFQDCQESWECRVSCNSTSPVGYKDSEREGEREEELTMLQVEKVDDEEQGMEKQPKYVFCVIGQTLPLSQPGYMSLSQVDQMGEMGRENPALEKCYYCSDDATQQPQDDLHLTLSSNNEYLIISNQNKQDEAEQNTSKTQRSGTGETSEGEIRYITSMLQERETGKEMSRKVEYPCPEIKQIKRDSQTERLLVQWRGKNKAPEEEQRDQTSPVPSNPYADVCPEVNFEQIFHEINAGVQNPEKNEAVHVQMKKGWTMFEESKKHSQAPHLKWAKNVVRNILGNSEEETVDEDSEETETVVRRDTHEEEVAKGTKEIPFISLTTIGQHSDPELEEEDPLEDLRGMGESQGDTHTEQFTAMYDDTPTHTHADTLLNTEGKKDHSVDKDTESSGLLQLEKDVEMKLAHEAGDEVLLSETENEKETDMYLSSGNTLYKPNSCPILNYESTSEPIKEGKSQELKDRMGESEEEMQREEPEACATTVDMGKMEAKEMTELDNREKEVTAERKIEVGTLTSTNSFQDFGPEARIRRRGIRKTTERRNDEPVELEEEEGVGRDRRTRIFSTTDDEDELSKTWGGGAEISNVFNTFVRRRRNSKFFKRTQLYQQYNEAAQNLEILSQSGSAVLPLPEDSTQSPAPSPPPARRPLPALPPVLHPHSLFHTSSLTSAKSLPLPEPPRKEGRPLSPRLGTSFTQSPTLWRDLPGVKNNPELAELTEDQRRLQEVHFEVVTSEASYCRSLDIVVEHFVKAKQLGALLTSQDRNWLFSRLADVRAISHSFLSKLEERVESDIMHFTVCDLIAQHCPRFRKVYVPYLTNQSYQDATYQRLMNENPGFKSITEKLERSSVCERLPFRSFLVLPFQRITRIKLLVQNIVKRTTPGTAEATQAIKAMKHLEKLIQESNDSISQMKNIESLVSLNAKVDFECKTLPLVSQSRRLIREGPVTELMDFSLKDTERNAYLHLFNDFLLVSLQKEGGRFTVIDHSPVSELRVENCRVKLHTLQKNLFRLHMAHKSLLLRADTQSDKLRWISALSRPHPEVDFSAAQDVPQMQCIRAFVAQQPDELSLDKADIILVHQSSDHWVEGTRLPDCHRGWVPESNLETISNPRVRQRNLSDALKLTTATAAV